jgi:hypothetical protein
MKKTTTTIITQERITKILVDNGYPEDAKIGHIDYDPSVTLDNYDERIVDSVEHNGDYILVANKIDKALNKLINAKLISKGFTEEERADLKDIKYTVGDITLVNELPEVSDPYWKHNKITATIYLPVKVEYIFNT